MKTFKSYSDLHEGYTFVPKTVRDITSSVKTKSSDATDILSFIFKTFQVIYGVAWKDALPISTPPRNVVTVKLRRDFDIKELVSPLKKQFSKFSIIKNARSLTVKDGRSIILKVEEGEGSRNNKAGGGAKGISFEHNLARDIEEWGKGGSVKYKGIVSQLSDILKSQYKIDLKKDDYEVIIDGGKNQKRKPEWNKSKGMTFTPSGNIGKIVTDLTVKSGNKKAFLSLKFGSQFYIINASIRPYLHTNKLNVDVKERNDIIKYFGFNPKKFLNAYNIMSNDDSQQSSGITKKVWANILKEVIGKGYIYVVGGGRRDIVIDSHSEPKITVNSIGEVLYALEGKRKYSKISISATIDGRKYNMDCQFRGTTATDVLPYYLRVLVK